MAKRVIIVGGGLAGLAATEALSARGIDVTLFESRPRLGGRASSFEDRTTGALIDNCQHVSLGCCTNFQKFCESTGLADAFRTEPQLYFVANDRRLNRFAETRWPAPFHLESAFRRLSFLTWRDRVALARGLAALAKRGSQRIDDERFDRWLADHGQTENAVNRFWHVVLVSALSESLDRIGTSHARKVFVDTFLANRNGWHVQVPTVPLETLYGERLSSHLKRQRATICVGTGVRRLIAEGDRIVSVELRNGETVTGDEFVVAVPHHLLRSLLPPSIAEDDVLRQIERLETAPISSVHLWFDRSITDLPHAVLVDRLGQWMFNRTALQGASAGGSMGHYYQIVISASRELEGTPSGEAIATVRDELNEIWPAARDAELLHSRLVTEHRAVFSATPESDRFRPAQQSPVANLQLAGDWTSTGWPATMEGAVRSGYLAAENVLARLGRPGPLIQPDLPIGRLSRWLFGLESSGPGSRIRERPDQIRHDSEQHVAQAAESASQL